ncbi:MAG: hypothetical protein JWN72_189 [Thermoleophilia bacterium]|nr:hypothetical protein [Thermoleophilia bacterium]
MFIGPAGIAGVIAGATTMLTGADLARTGSRTVDPELREGIARATKQTLVEGAAITGASLLLKPLSNVFPFLSKIGPAGVTLAFAAGTLLSVAGHLKEANAHKDNPAYHKLFMSGAIGSSIESAGLVAMGIGLLPVVPLPAKIALIGAGALALAVGWPTSLGHGPLAAAIH